MKKRFLASMLGIVLSLSLVVTPLMDVHAEDVQADVQVQEALAEEELTAENEDQQIVAEEETEAEKTEEITTEEEVPEELPEEEIQEESKAQAEEKTSKQKVETMANSFVEDCSITKEPTKQNPISKVGFMETNDGNYEIQVTLSNLTTLCSEYLDKAKGWELVVRSLDDSTKYLIYSQGDYKGEDTFSVVSTRTTLKPGEKFRAWFYLLDADPQDPDVNTIYGEFASYDFTTPTSTFNWTTDFRIESYETGIDDTYGTPFVKLEFTENTGNDWQIIKEDLATGISKLMPYANYYYTHYNHYEDENPGSLEYDHTYRYYLVKYSSKDEQVNSLMKSLEEGKTLTSADKTLIASRTAQPVTITTDKPILAKITNVTTKVGLENMQLNWETTDRETGVMTTGYQIYQNGKLVQTYADTSYDGSLSISLSIPYTGVQKFKIRSYFVCDGKTYYGDWSDEVSCESQKLGAGSLAITKINSNQVRIRITNGNGATVNDVYVSSGKSWKKIKSHVKGAFTYKAKKAGSQKYYVVGARYTGGCWYTGPKSKTVKPASNIKELSYYRTKPNAEARKYATASFSGKKMYYSGGKLKIAGYLVNSRWFALKKVKVTITVYSQGKKIAKQTFKYNKKIKAMGVKSVTFTFKKAKKNYDLRDSKIYYTVSPTWF